MNGLPVPFGRQHYSEVVGSAQKLPNGNMLVCEGMNGRWFQLTSDHELVWEYINPYAWNPRDIGAVQKAKCYPPDYCPQFKNLPPAKGAAVSPTVVAASGRKGWLGLGSARAARPAIATAVLLALVTFVVGWKWGNRRAASALLASGKLKAARDQPTGKRGKRR